MNVNCLVCNSVFSLSVPEDYIKIKKYVPAGRCPDCNILTIAFQDLATGFYVLQVVEEEDGTKTDPD